MSSSTDWMLEDRPNAGLPADMLKPSWTVLWRKVGKGFDPVEQFPTCDGPADGKAMAPQTQKRPLLHAVSTEILMSRVCLMASLNSSREKRSSGRPGMALHHQSAGGILKLKRGR